MSTERKNEPQPEKGSSTPEHETPDLDVKKDVKAGAKPNKPLPPINPQPDPPG
jgi:hypothetical protein